MERSISITLIAVALLAAPTGLAQWSSYGDREPNTPYDKTNFMFQDPTVSGAPRIYFNAFATTWTFVNPNVAALGTRQENAPIESNFAILGIWRDCNGDNYIGMAEGALREYDSLLLTDATICPPASGSPDEWDGVSHNYNGWVSEFVPIANDQIDTEWDVRQLHDPEVMIWGDFGQPDDSSEIAGGTCAIRPLPRGTLQSTGAALNYADCFGGANGFYELVNFATRDEIRLLGQDLPGAGDPAGLSVENDDDGRGHPVWDRPTLGSEDAEYSAVRAWDCSGETIRVGDYANSTAPGHDESVPDDTPVLNARGAVWAVHDIYQYPVNTNPVGNTEDPTVPATVNETYEGGFEDCDYSNDRGADVYGLAEGDFVGVPATGKNAADWNFEYGSSGRGRYVNFGEDLNGDGTNETIDNPLRPGLAGANQYGGVGASPTFSAEWFGGSNLVKSGGPNTVATRANLRDGTVNPGPDDAYWLTFYAFVGSASTDAGYRLPGGTGKYGAAQCGLNTSGIRNGWECDATQWNLNADGSPIASDVKLAAPGQTYNLRDVDCQDGGNDLGVGLGVPYYGEGRCPV